METEPLDGDPNAADPLLPLVYEELRRMAAHRMARERAGQTLQATALVHEAWLRLNDSNQQQWRGREHFLSAAAESMHRILVERARRKSRVRHGGDCERVDWELFDLPIATDAAEPYRQESDRRSDQQGRIPAVCCNLPDGMSVSFNVTGTIPSTGSRLL